MEIFILGILILLNGFFALSEIAIVSSSKAKLEHKKSSGNKGAVFALILLEKPENFLSAIQVGITVVGIISGAYGGLNLSGDLEQFLNSYNIFFRHSKIIALSIVITSITYFSIVIGELVPKTFALNNPEKIAVIVSPVIYFLSKTAYPVVGFLSLSTNLLLKILFIKNSRKTSFTQDELRMTFRIAKTEGIISSREAEIYQNLFRFFDRRAEQVMTRRNEITWIDINEKPAAIDDIIMSSPHSKFPLCNNDLEHTVGIVTLKDYITIRNKKKYDLKTILKPVLFVSETSRTLKILENFREQKCHFAMVMDEYGAVQGIITLHDLTENILGDLPEPDIQLDPRIVKRNERSYLIDGLTQIDELAEIFDIKDFKTPGDSYNTIAGYIMHRLGRIAHTGDSIRADNYKIEVVDLDGLKIDKVLVTKTGK
jgi:putative hemolysin